MSKIEFKEIYSMRRARLLFLLCAVGPCHLVYAQPRVNITIDSSEIRFKSAILQERVAESVEQAKQNDLSYVNELMRLNKANPDRVLTFFEKFKKHPISNVRFAVIEAASNVKTTKSLSILTSMVTDPDVGHDAVRVLYDNYDCEEIATKGGKRLQSSLLRKFVSDRYSTYGTMLLACFNDSDKVTNLLEMRRKSYLTNSKRVVNEELVAIDLTLIEMGKEEALLRIQNSFSQRKVENILIILRYIEKIQNSTVLLRIVELLKDNNKARRIGAPDEPPKYTRMSDEALEALSLKFGSSNRMGYGPPQRYSDSEIKQAYTRFKKLYSAK